jgi:hypothetical protein
VSRFAQTRVEGKAETRTAMRMTDEIVRRVIGDWLKRRKPGPKENFLGS